MTPRTVVIPGNGTNSLRFTIPAEVDFNVESVVASVNAAAAGDTIGELSVAEVTGAVIATKRQGLPIPGGGSGTETWALRLDDELAVAAAAAGYPLAVSNINGFYNVTTGAAVQIGVDDGNIATESPAIFATAAHATPGLFGIGITGSGTYAAFWTVNYVDTAIAPVAAPETFVNFAEDASGSLFSFLPALGSLYARGYVDNVGRSAWDVSWIDIFSIHGSTAANDPIIISAQQATGVTLRAYTNVWILQLTTTPFS